MNLYSIGQVSAIIGIPIKTIRYYESIGLCEPSKIDQYSGYRYYSIDDIFRLDLVRCLGRGIGMPLKIIRRYLNELGDAETLKAYLKQQEQDLDAQIELLAARKSFLSMKLNAITLREQTVSMCPYIRIMPPVELAVIRVQISSLEDALLLARRTAAQANAVEWANLYLIFDKLADRFSKPGKHEAVVGVSAPVSACDLQPYSLRGGKYICISYPNREQERKTAVEMLIKYIDSNGLVQHGPMVNVGSLIDTTAGHSGEYYLDSFMLFEPDGS